MPAARNLAQRRRVQTGASVPENFARYGLSRPEVEAAVIAQGHRCLICREVPRVWVVDHDHAQAELHGHFCCRLDVRGLICDPCNRMLGAARDSQATLERAVLYLRTWEARRGTARG